MRQISSMRSVFFLALLGLAACGGGGGGGGGSSGPVTPPAGIPVPFQAPGTTVTYAVDSAAASVIGTSVTGQRIDAAGTGSTVALTSGSNGNLTNASFNIATPTTRFVQSYGGSQLTPLPSLTLSYLSNTITALLNTPGANGFISAGAGLSYSTYGAWGSNDFTSGRIGVLAGGSATPASAMPTSGTATYTGQTIGTGTNTTGAYALLGNATIQVNFGTNAATITLNNTQQQYLGTNSVITGPTLTGTGTISGNRMAGTLSGTGLSGTHASTFYGPAAQENAGVWSVAGSGGSAQGSWGTRR